MPSWIVTFILLLSRAVAVHSSDATEPTCGLDGAHPKRCMKHSLIQKNTAATKVVSEEKLVSDGDSEDGNLAKNATVNDDGSDANADAGASAADSPKDDDDNDEDAKVKDPVASPEGPEGEREAAGRLVQQLLDATTSRRCGDSPCPVVINSVNVTINKIINAAPTPASMPAGMVPMPVPASAGMVPTPARTPAGMVPMPVPAPAGMVPTPVPAPAPTPKTTASSTTPIAQPGCAVGTVKTLAGDGRAGYAEGIGTEARFKSVVSISYSPDGTLLAVADRYNYRIRLVAVSTGKVTLLAGNGDGANELGRRGANARYRDGTGTHALFALPEAVSFSPDGKHVAVADDGNHRIREVEVISGKVVTLAGKGGTTGNSGYGGFRDGPANSAMFNSPQGVSWSPDGKTLAVADVSNHRIRLVVASTGKVTSLAGYSEGYKDAKGTSARFNRPLAVSYSPDGKMLAVADSKNNRIRLVNVSNGNVTTLAGSSATSDRFQRHKFRDGIGTHALFNLPSDVSWSPDGEVIAVADTANNRIRLVVVSTGKVTTAAGSGKNAFREGTGRAASFSGPSGVAYSPNGMVLAVADEGNQRIRLVQLQPHAC